MCPTDELGCVAGVKWRAVDHPPPLAPRLRMSRAIKQPTL